MFNYPEPSATELMTRDEYAAYAIRERALGNGYCCVASYSGGDCVHSMADWHPSDDEMRADGWTRNADGLWILEPGINPSCAHGNSGAFCHDCYEDAGLVDLCATDGRPLPR